MIYEYKIFKNEEILSPEYLPDLLPHRENQIKQLAQNLLPASRGKKAQDMFIFGGSGIGKTAVVKFVFRKFEEEYSNIKTIYINCWDFNTAIAVISKIVIDLGFPVQRRGWSKDEIISRFVETLNKTRENLVVCLDEVDQLIYKDPNALYDLLRINQYVGKSIGLIFISNNPHVFANLDSRTSSSLAVEEIEFKPYTLEEMRDILQERAKYAFSSFESAVVLLAANHSVRKGGDVRVGLQCLLKAGRTAEQENANKVKVEHIKKILRDVEKVKPEILKEKVSGTEKIILEIFDKENELSFGELYKKYCERVKNPITDRAFRDYVKHLNDVKLLEIKKRKIRGGKI